MTMIMSLCLLKGIKIAVNLLVLNPLTMISQILLSFPQLVYTFAHFLASQEKYPYLVLGFLFLLHSYLYGSNVNDI